MNTENKIRMKIIRVERNLVGESLILKIMFV